jgi:sugar fermentation stimulation protein A
MLGLKAPGLRVAVSYQAGTPRHYPYTLEAVEVGGTLVGVNTMRPNRLVSLALAHGQIEELAGYAHHQAEVVVSNSRLDFRLFGEGRPDCYLEVKNAQLKRHDALEFPDAKTERGVKHLHLLRTLAQRGERAVLLFLGQRSDASLFRIAKDLDPAYHTAFHQALDAGVEAYCYIGTVCPQATEFVRRIPIDVSATL